MKESHESQIKLSVLLCAHTHTSVYLFVSFKKDTLLREVGVTGKECSNNTTNAVLASVSLLSIARTIKTSNLCIDFKVLILDGCLLQEQKKTI